MHVHARLAMRFRYKVKASHYDAAGTQPLIATIKCHLTYQLTSSDEIISLYPNYSSFTMASPNTALTGLLDGSSFYSVPDALGSSGLPGVQAIPQPQQAGQTAALSVPSYLQPGSILNPTDPALNTLSGAQIASMVHAANSAPAVPSPSAYLNFPTAGNTPTYSQLAGMSLNPVDNAMHSPLGTSTLTGLAGHKAASVTAGSVMGGNNETEVALDDVLRALDNMKVLAGRMEQLLAEQAKAQAAVFDSAQAEGGSTAVMALQTECEPMGMPARDRSDRRLTA